ncbi:MAG: 50S ribosomal protein L35 [Betaproteobacteria bacterium]|nr:50S ribosomal protein L35 [Betaproteobacteria bacterium]
MPKMKTRKGAAKRFKVRPGGTVKRSQAFKRHILTKKATKMKRQLRGITAVCASDVQSVRAMLPYA